MRSIYLLPLTALVTITAGCRPEVKESGSVPPRDLTLVTQTPAVKIASAEETQQPRVYRRAPRPSQPAVRPARAPRTISVEPKVQLAVVTVTAPAPANDRELLPGTTVTLIPASTGPSAGPDDTAELPAVHGRTIVARGGGKYPGGGRGPGIARAPRPDFRAGS